MLPKPSSFSPVRPLWGPAVTFVTLIKMIKGCGFCYAYV